MFIPFKLTNLPISIDPVHPQTHLNVILTFILAPISPFLCIGFLKAISWQEKGPLPRFPPIWCIFAACTALTSKFNNSRYIFLNYLRISNRTLVKLAQKLKQKRGKWTHIIWFLLSSVVGLLTLKVWMLKLTCNNQYLFESYNANQLTNNSILA